MRLKVVPRKGTYFQWNDEYIRVDSTENGKQKMKMNSYKALAKIVRKKLKIIGFQEIKTNFLCQ